METMDYGSDLLNGVAEALRGPDPDGFVFKLLQVIEPHVISKIDKSYRQTGKRNSDPEVQLWLELRASHNDCIRCGRWGASVYDAICPWCFFSELGLNLPANVPAYLVDNFVAVFEIASEYFEDVWHSLDQRGSMWDVLNDIEHYPALANMLRNEALIKEMLRAHFSQPRPDNSKPISTLPRDTPAYKHVAKLIRKHLEVYLPKVPPLKLHA